MPVLVGDLNLTAGAEQFQTLFFMRIDHDLTDRRSAGSYFWAVLLNTHLGPDLKSGIASIVMPKLTPFLDPIFMDVYSEFEQAVYLDQNISSRGS